MLALKMICLSGLILSFTDGFCQNKYEWKEGTENGYKYSYVSNDPMKARFFTLKNGLTVILSPSNKEPRIKTLIGVRAGSNSDPKEHTGLAHYLEHMLFKGTYRFGTVDSTKEKTYIQEIDKLYEKYNSTSDPASRRTIYRTIDSISGIAAKYAIANEYTKMMASMGSEGTNAHTWVEETVYEENIPANVIDKFLKVQSERFRNPVLRLFHTELEAVYEEKNMSLDDDDNKVFEALMASLFPTHNYGQQTTIGTVEHLKNPSLKAIREFYHKNYVAANMCVIMSGDFKTGELIAKIDRAFSFLPRGEDAGYKGPDEAPLTAPVTREVVGPDAEFLQLAYRLPGADDYQAGIIATVVGQLLYNGKAGLFDINLNKQQKVLSSTAANSFWKDYSFIRLIGRAKQDQSLDEVKDLMLSEVERLKKGDFDEALIKAVAANFKLVELNGLESNDTRANTLMQSFILHKGKDWRSDVAFVDDLAKVTKQQVVDFVSKYLGNNYVVVFKKKGESKAEKVEKPVITPVAMNTDLESDFAKSIDRMPVAPVSPRWVDYNKEISKSRIGGADMLYVQNKKNEIFRLYYRFDIGTWNNKVLPLAANYLQFLGDGQRTADQISREFYNLACNFSVTPSNEYTQITLTGLQENFDKASKLLENLILNCKPDEKALQSLKARIVKSRSDSKLNKDNIIRGLVNYATYGPENPFNNQLNAAELKAISAGELVDLLHHLFKYKHTVIYYGPSSLEQAASSIKKAHNLPSQLQTLPGVVTFEKKPTDSTRVLFNNYDMVQSEIYWVNNSMPYDSSKTAEIELYNNYFGSGMSSIVFQTIRESKALAYSTGAIYLEPEKKNDRCRSLAYVGTQADKMNDAITAMNELLGKLPKIDKGIAEAKASILQNIASERISDDAVIFNYLLSKRLGLSSDVRKIIYETVPKLGFGDLSKFHSEYVAGKPYVYCIVASRNKINVDDLKKIGTLQELSLEEIFGY